MKEKVGEIMLRLIKERAEKVSGHWRNLYECSCGKRKLIYASNVKSGKTTSCGCIHKEMSKGLLSTHKMSKTYTYGVWAGMKGRCLVKTNGSYKKYGGAGITLCERWHSFENFISDMGEAPEGMTLDRIDGRKGYSPENCRWVSYQAQAINRKVSSNSKTGVKGVTYKKERDRYAAIITVSGKKKFLGYFKLKSEAIAARVSAEKLYFSPIVD